MSAYPARSKARVQPAPATAPWDVGLLDANSPWPGFPIGEILVRTGALLPANLDRALILQEQSLSQPLGVILLSEHMISENALARGLALQKGVRRATDLAGQCDHGLAAKLGPDTCLRLGVIPLFRHGAFTIVATARPQRFETDRAILEDALGPVRMAVADGGEITETVLAQHSTALVGLAEARPAPDHSLRGWQPRRMAAVIASLCATLLSLTILAPAAALTLLTGLAILALAGMTGLRIAALVATLRNRHPDRRPDLAPESWPEDWPRISLLVPLLREADITAHLMSHLNALDYPLGRLDICLIVEAGDTGTSDALTDGLTPSARLVTVPKGTLQTKPRALNYALDFACGDIIGVYDAEDAPDPDQLRKIARHFATAPPDVVCLQGCLDFYNPRQNWLARCFTIDYAAWFRVFLPGLARLGFAVPLGGTSLFFRREALEELGRWDAHNVTEDADLGIRLARRGWRTELAHTTTLEEANCHVRPWIRQRSRWLKGYALTWAVHMRNPLRLWRELGARKFLGFQAMFLGTILLFLLAPLMWSFWLIPLGIWHPLSDVVPGTSLAALAVFFLASEAVNMAAAITALATAKDRWLIPWVPLTIFYFPLAAIASYRAIAGIAGQPFFWDKTQHGLSPGKPEVNT